MKFDVSRFESAFYGMLYRDFSLDMVEFNRKICYNGRVYRVSMVNSRLTCIVDLSGIHPKLVYGGISENNRIR